MANGSLISRLPYDDYARFPGVSITRLKELKQSPLRYQHVLKEGLPETDALRLGIAAHTATLEPERFGSQFAVWSRRGESGKLCPRTGQYWEVFRERHTGCHIITEDDQESAMAIANAIQACPAAARYLVEGEPEVSMQWETWVEAPMGMGRTVPCRGRVDWITYLDDVPHLIGLKTARDVSPFYFGSAAYRLFYHAQWAFYRDGFLEIKGIKPVLKEIVVESKPPYDVVVYNVNQDVIDQGRQDYMQLLKTWVECEYTGRWPGCANGLELDVTLPTYAFPSGEDLDGLELDHG